MDDYRTLHDRLRKASGGAQTVTIWQGIVNSVSGCTCEVQIGSIAIPEVRLRASLTDDDNEMLVVPAPGSAVTVGSLSGDLSELVVLQVDRVKSVTVNGGKLGGLVNIAQLTDKLNALVKAFNAHTHQVTVVHPGGTVVSAAPASGAESFNRKDYEDTTIKH
jgi:hypothetical protein